MRKVSAAIVLVVVLLLPVSSFAGMFRAEEGYVITIFGVPIGAVNFRAEGRTTPYNPYYKRERIQHLPGKVIIPGRAVRTRGTGTWDGYGLSRRGGKVRVARVWKHVHGVHQ